MFDDLALLVLVQESQVKQIEQDHFASTNALGSVTHGGVALVVDAAGCMFQDLCFAFSRMW